MADAPGPAAGSSVTNRKQRISDKKIAGISLQYRAAQIFFFLVMFQLPLFKMECRQGPCVSPVEVMAGQLAFAKFVPEVALKVLLWPGSVWRYSEFERSSVFPQWDFILDDYNITTIGLHRPKGSVYVHRLDIIAGSMFAVGGAVSGIFSPSGRMSLLGMLLIVWGCYKHLIFAPSVDDPPQSEVLMQLLGWVALFCASSTINYSEEKKRLFPAKPANSAGWDKSRKERLQSRVEVLNRQEEAKAEDKRKLGKGKSKSAVSSAAKTE